MNINQKEKQAERMDNENSLKPLVSIVVVTYNSAKYVLETLESAKAQSYPNLELIVTDDCSTDNTLEICKDWLEKNTTRFVRTELITIEKNTGIPANCNRGFTAAKGKWIKGIAGDDILFKDCVLDGIQFINKNSEIKIFQSLAKVYLDTFEENNFRNTSTNLNHPFGFLTSEQQYRLLHYQSFPIAAAIFIKRSFFLDMGKYDESLPLEDWTFWLKITKRKEKIYQLDKVTVGYRIHNKSAFHQKQNKSIFSKYYLTDRKVYNKYIKDDCSKITKFFLNYKHYTRLFFDKLGLNNNSIFIFKALFWLLNKPYHYHIKHVLSRLEHQMNKTS
ncbi:glycosyltransferase [Maribacter polysiphoniae]|uniref:glycosyltransferase n=1 Tax=Maribacter polysiphoniae TaxID=429344 RepID=UPI0023573F2B|nr:glycosyltransferase [Maribacter polysiphoniae]